MELYCYILPVTSIVRRIRKHHLMFRNIDCVNSAHSEIDPQWQL